MKGVLILNHCNIKYGLPSYVLTVVGRFMHLVLLLLVLNLELKSTANQTWIWDKRFFSNAYV